MKKQTGFTLKDGWEFFATVPKGFTLIEDNQAPYRFVWINREQKQILSYCEGDIYLDTCETAEEFERELIKLKNFYDSLLIDV